MQLVIKTLQLSSLIVGNLFDSYSFISHLFLNPSFSLLMSRKRTLLLALLLLPLIQARPAFAHGSHGGGVFVDVGDGHGFQSKAFA